MAKRDPHKGMRMEYTAVVKLCGEWWIGWTGELPSIPAAPHKETRSKSY